MSGRWRSTPALVLLGLAACAGPLGLAMAQTGGFNERDVTTPSGSDKPGEFTLDFRFKDPRTIKVNIPGRGPRVCYYMWYQVINRTGQPRTFIPDFELVTLDHPGAYHDEVLPSVQEAIKKIEDVTSYQDIKNSVTIAATPIPASKSADEAFPRAVTGVAIWDGGAPAAGKKGLADSTRFSVFVSGLSNGWVLVDPVGQGPKAEPVIRRKTLQLNFKRTGAFGTASGNLTFVPAPEWVHRVARLRLPDAAAPNPPAAKGPNTR